MSDRDHYDFRYSTFNGPVIARAEHDRGPVFTAMSALPAPPTAFTGREQHVRALLDVLDPGTETSADAVLISAVGGLGGVGKTALALHVAHAARARFPGGTLFVNMRGYDDSPTEPEQAVTSFLTALGIGRENLPSAPEELYALYRSALNSRGAVLIVLDNVSAAAQVVPLLPGDTRHRVLVTSRDSFDSLTARSITLDSLSQDEAVALIERSLTISDPDDSRASDEPDAVRILVDLCGRLPLALQIAAAQLRRRKTRPVSTLVADLRAAVDRVSALRAPGKDQYERDLLLRPVFDVTYGRLDADQARLFRLLAHAPAADFGHPTAVALSGISPADIMERLEDLAAVYLISSSPDGDRWVMHDLLRAYASTLSASEPVLAREATDAKNSLLQDFCLRTVSADKHLHGQLLADVPDLFPDRHAALAWLDSEHTSLIRAIQWAENAEHSNFATALGVCVDRYLQLQRHFTDGILVSETLLTAARRDEDRFLEMIALTTLGHSQHQLRLYRETAITHTKALRLAYSLNDHSAQATGWSNLGYCMHDWGQHDIAAEMLGRAQEMFSQLGDEHREAMAWNTLGMPLLELRRFGEDAQAHRNAQKAFHQTGDRQRDATAWINLGTALRAVSEFEDAVNAYMNAADLFAEQHDRYGEASAWNNVGSLLIKLREFETASEILHKCEAVFVSLREWHRVGAARWNIAQLHESQGRVLDARAAWKSAADAYALAGDEELATSARQNAEQLTPTSRTRTTPTYRGTAPPPPTCPPAPPR
ncbi:ATP-binding protein [Streptomyces sp. B21-083]|uniref:ATP-binding protein n=1 Tax=Streptomyces sp. B21-083 TaxID=3039410 RepID=UPI002FF3F8AA